MSTLITESVGQGEVEDEARAQLSAQLRRARRGLWVVDALFVAVAVVFVMLAPLGNWKNRVLGVELWYNGDPGAGYAVASLFAFSGENRVFVGHPGMPLTMMLGTAAAGWHVIYSMSGGHEKFFDYWARHVRVLFVMAGLLAALLHVLSFHLLFAFARRVAGDARVALLAVVAYATAFPVLFYAVRLSPEGLLVSGFLGTMLALWNAQERKEEGRGRRALLWAAVAGVVSVATVYSKIHLAAPLPMLACAQLLLQGGAGRRLGEKIRERGGMLGVFVASAAAGAAVMALKVDWVWFFQWWRRYQPGETQIDMSGKYVRPGEVGMLKGIWIALKRSVGQWVPGMTPMGIFVMAEGVFLILAVWGLVWWWRRNPRKRGIMFWPILYVGLITPIAVYRSSWHYLFLHVAIGAVMLAMLMGQWMKQWRSGRGWLGPALAAVVVMHGASIFFFISGKVDDVKRYRENEKICVDALERLRGNQRLAVIAPENVKRKFVSQLTSRWIARGQAFERAMYRLIVVVEDEGVISEKWKKEQKIGAVIRFRERKMGEAMGEE